MDISRLGADPDDATAIDRDVILELLPRLDGATLAAAACLDRGLRSIVADENLWENACNSKWPSTADPDVKSIVCSAGGFRSFYAECCYPVLVNEEPLTHSNVAVDLISFKDVAEAWLDEEGGATEEVSGVSKRDFVSIVDVVFRGCSVYYKVVDEIPDARNCQGRFFYRPFKIDLLNLVEDEMPGGVEGLPFAISTEQARNSDKLWQSLWDDFTLSWVLVDKNTKKMANLASWRPLDGQRNFPTYLDFILRFGSILPGHRLLSCKVVHCNITMKCRLYGSALLGDERGSGFHLKITQLSLQLEDLEGTCLNGRDSLLVLKEALACKKSRNHTQALNSYRQYLEVGKEMKREKLRTEGRLNSVRTILGIASFISF